MDVYSASFPDLPWDGPVFHRKENTTVFNIDTEYPESCEDVAYPGTKRVWDVADQEKRIRVRLPILVPNWNPQMHQGIHLVDAVDEYFEYIVNRHQLQQMTT